MVTTDDCIAHLHLNPYLLYDKASLWQIRALWFFLGRDFAVQTVSKETVQALYFCFGASKAGRFKINNQNSEKK